MSEGKGSNLPSVSIIQGSIHEYRSQVTSDKHRSSTSTLLPVPITREEAQHMGNLILEVRCQLHYKRERIRNDHIRNSTDNLCLHLCNIKRDNKVVQTSRENEAQSVILCALTYLSKFTVHLTKVIKCVLPVASHSWYHLDFHAREPHDYGPSAY